MNMHQTTQCYQSKGWLTKILSIANVEGDHLENLMLEIVQLVTCPPMCHLKKHVEVQKDQH